MSKTKAKPGDWFYLKEHSGWQFVTCILFSVKRKPNIQQFGYNRLVGRFIIKTVKEKV